MRQAFAALFAVPALAAAASAACPTAASSAPFADFWVYGFGSGATTYAPTFGSPFNTTDPDRLGYYFAVFEFPGLDAGTLPPISALTFEVTLLNSSTFDPTNTVLYDPTYDARASYLDRSLDEDPGRPIELYAVELAGGRDLAALRESDSMYLPAPEYYVPQPIDFGGGGPRRVLYSIDGAPEPGTAPGFDTEPLAIATAEGVGARIPDGTRLRFQVSPSPAARAYLTEQIRTTGRIAFVVSSLHSAGEFGAGGEDIWPRLATKESFGTLDPSVQIAFGSAADFDGNGSVDVNDLLGFLGAFRVGGAGADFDGSGSVDVNDLLGFLGAFRAGGC